MMNYEVVSHYAAEEKQKRNISEGTSTTLQVYQLLNTSKNAAHMKTYLVNAINGFFKSISLTPTRASTLQDILRLLTLWFDYGSVREVEYALHSGFHNANIDTWLIVLPQVQHISMVNFTSC